MLNVAEKAATHRTATAQVRILVQPETLENIRRGKIAKGDVLAVAQTAGIMGAKRTPDLIPMCHPLLITSVDVDSRKTRSPTATATAASRRRRPSRPPGRPGSRWRPSLRCPSPRSRSMTCARPWTGGWCSRTSACWRRPEASPALTGARRETIMITLKLFGMLETIAKNQAELRVSLNGGRTVSDLVGFLEKDYPEMAELIHKKNVLVSVNHEIAHPDKVSNEGDDVALLPPFAGGAPADPEDMLVRVQREDFSIDVELTRVRARSSRIGGIAIFLGTARDRSKGHDVSGIKFEYYEGMAQKKLREIRERALKDFDVIEVLIIHRYGDIQVGENIVLVIAAAEHRADAFPACKCSNDELM